MVVISVIGIIAAIAVPNIATVSRHAHYAKDERNAQNVASLAIAAQNAGATNNWTTVTEVLDDLENTVKVSVNSAGPAVEFRIGPFSEEEREKIAEFLSVTNGVVYYNAAGN